MARVKIIHGKTNVPPSKHTGVELKGIIGKRIVAIGQTSIENENGREPAVVLFLEDHTKHTFCLPTD